MARGIKKAGHKIGASCRHRFGVDSQINNWLAKSNLTVHKTNVAFKALRDRGWDAAAGKTTTRRALAIAITVLGVAHLTETGRSEPHIIRVSACHEGWMSFRRVSMLMGMVQARDACRLAARRISAYAVK